MEENYHRDVFSWPHREWVHEGSLCPTHLGVDVIEHGAIDHLRTLADDATKEGQDESLAVFDLGAVVDRFFLWNETFPNIQPFYAMKAYDDPVVINVLTNLGAGVDCSSKKEIDIALKCGVPPESILFASTVKFPSHLRFAKSYDVASVTVDNEEEMYKIQKYAPKSKLVIRMAPLPTSKVELALNVKFGCSREGATRLLKLALQLDLDVVGISFHVGSGCSDPQTYVNHIKAARQLFDDAQGEGFKLNLLDLGGGLFGNIEAEQHLKKMAGPITDTLAELFPESSGVKVIAEPGRYFVESALYLATSVIGKRPPSNGHAMENCDTYGTKHETNVVPEKDQAAKVPLFLPGSTSPQPEVDFEYYISESVFGLLVQHLYIGGYQYNISPLKIQGNEDAPTYSSKLWGPSLDSVDLVTECCKLPELYIGDWLVFKDVGSYSVVVGGTFNALPKPSIHRVIEQSTWDKLLDAIIDIRVTQK